MERDLEKSGLYAGRAGKPVVPGQIGSMRSCLGTTFRYVHRG